MDNIDKNEEWGLVFTGGGGKGAFQVGAWRALIEAKMTSKIAAVSGASVGILNAAMFAMGDIKRAEKIWHNIDPLMFLEPDLKIMNDETFVTDWVNPLQDVIEKYSYVLETGKTHLFAKNKQGVFSRDGLKKIINENIDMNVISNGNIKLYTDMCRCEDEKLVLRYEMINGKSREDIVNIMLAASSLPFVYDAVYYDDGYYRDGGILDNVPIKPLYDAGYRNIIVVGLKPDYEIDYSKFEGCRFIFIMPSVSLGDFMHGTLDFTAEGAKFRMALGYRNAARVLKAYKDGMMDRPDYRQWLNQMSVLDEEAAKQDVRQYDIEHETNSHLDKIKSIYDKYL